METGGLILVGLAIVAGLAGIVVPILPGILLIWAAVLVWALFEQTTLAWTVLGVSSVLAVASQIVKFAVPDRRLRTAGVPRQTILIGAAAGIIGFFVVPVIGLFAGFILGVYVAELVRLGSHANAWPSTVHALKAVGVSILVELGAGLLIGATWLGAVVFG